VYVWEVPDVATSNGFIRVRARDGDGNLGGSLSGDFVVEGTSVPGDVDGDGYCNVNDILAVVGAWGPCASPCPEDLDGDGYVEVDDILILLGYFEG
jgi:hypothetical protein